MNGLTIELHTDNDCESPRNYDDDCVITYASERHILGDVSLTHSASSLEDAFLIHLTEKDIKLKDVIWLPVYFLNHSGIKLSTTSFRDLWDSYKSGYIYMTKKKAYKRWSWDRMSVNRYEQVYDVLRFEVDIYSKWLNGERYGFIIKDEAGEKLETSWNYIGKKCCLEIARESVQQLSNQTILCT